MGPSFLFVALIVLCTGTVTPATSSRCLLSRSQLINLLEIPGTENFDHLDLINAIWELPCHDGEKDGKEAEEEEENWFSFAWSSSGDEQQQRHESELGELNSLRGGGRRDEMLKEHSHGGSGVSMIMEIVEDDGDDVYSEETEKEGAERWSYFTQQRDLGHKDKEAKDVLKFENDTVSIVASIVCVTCAALAAGLTMGLVSIDPLEMAIKVRTGTPAEKAQAEKVLPLITRHHLLLVTLLLFNSLANEALPIFLDNLFPSVVAVIMSVTLVLFFGEILPSAFFTGPNGLAISAAFAPFVLLLMAGFSPIAWPIAWALDRMLGVEGLKTYSRMEIAALMEVQHELQQDPNSFEGGASEYLERPLHQDEVAIVGGVLKTSERHVGDAMVLMDKVYCLSMDSVLDVNTMADIIAAGYSRVLVYEGYDTRNIRGYLQVKKLIAINPQDNRILRSLQLRVPEVVSPHKSLLELLNIFQKGLTHIALVSSSPKLTAMCIKNETPLEGAARPIGIITLEDIIEEILQEEIYDESDRMTQNIEARAKKVFLKYARKRAKRKRFSRYAAISHSPSNASQNGRSRSGSRSSTRSGSGTTTTGDSRKQAVYRQLSASDLNLLRNNSAASLASLANIATPITALSRTVPVTIERARSSSLSPAGSRSHSPQPSGGSTTGGGGSGGVGGKKGTPPTRGLSYGSISDAEHGHGHGGGGHGEEKATFSSSGRIVTIQDAITAGKAYNQEKAEAARERRAMEERIAAQLISRTLAAAYRQDDIDDRESSPGESPHSGCSSGDNGGNGRGHDTAHGRGGGGSVAGRGILKNVSFNRSDDGKARAKEALLETEESLENDLEEQMKGGGRGMHEPLLKSHGKSNDEE